MAETKAELNKRMKEGYLKRKKSRSTSRSAGGLRMKAAKIKKGMAEGAHKKKEPVEGLLEKQGY